MDLLPLLDPRLSEAFRLYPHCSLGADIGCDHGLLPLHLLMNNRCEKMILTDISPHALKKGEALMKKYSLDKRSECFVGDGLTPLQQKVDAISILGMGGNTITHILSSQKEKLQGATLILSAHTHLEKIRGLLPQIQYRITEETVVNAVGRFYVLIKAEEGTSAYSPKERLLGPYLLKKPDKNTKNYWIWQHQVFTKALKGKRQSTDSNSDEESLFYQQYITYLEEELF